MKTISAAEARKRFAEITDDARTKNETYIIIRHGKEIARIVPPASEGNLRINPKLKKELASVFERYDEALQELAKR